VQYTPVPRQPQKHFPFSIGHFPFSISYISLDLACPERSRRAVFMEGEEGTDLFSPPLIVLVFHDMAMPDEESRDQDLTVLGGAQVQLRAGRVKISARAGNHRGENMLLIYLICATSFFFGIEFQTETNISSKRCPSIRLVLSHRETRRYSVRDLLRPGVPSC
jgi:hypothetical protein